MDYRLFIEQRQKHPKDFSVETIKAFQYLQDLANLTRVNLDTWDLQIFAQPNDGLLGGFNLIADKTQINKIFFEEVERRSKDPKLPTEALKNIPVADAEKYQKEVLDLAENQARKSAKLHENQAIAYQNNADQEIRRSIEFLARADSLAGTAKDMHARLNDILKLGPWQYSRINGAAVCFTPVADIWLNYRNASTQEHYRVNFGKLEVQLFPQQGNLLVYADKEGRSPVVNSYWHPHINNSGKVCLGDAANAFVRFMAQSDFHGAFDILFNLLTHYNPGSPYVELKRFQALQPDNKPGFVPNLCETCRGDLDLNRCVCCQVCSKHPDQCECYTCEICLETFLKENNNRCDCCQSCQRTGDDCACCKVCGLAPDEDGDVHCSCCHYCDSKTCKCEICPGINRFDGSSCSSKKRRCHHLCDLCMAHHVSDGGWCPSCNPESYQKDEELRRIDGERQRQEESEVVRQASNEIVSRTGVRYAVNPIPEPTGVGNEEIEFNVNDIPF